MSLECIELEAEDPGPQNYIFGYGSLIEDESRERTTPSARDAWPVMVRGLRRGWWARGAASGMTTTYLGALDDPSAHCNGVIYAVSKEELAATDRRESAGYRRCRIEGSAIIMLDGRDQPPEGSFWAYVNTIPEAQLRDNVPSEQFPMVQSYVDICINGCLEVEGKYPTAAGFARTFVETTHCWSELWVNDRVYPRRPFIFRPTAGRIDAVLRATAPTAELYYRVELEPATWEDRRPVRPLQGERESPNDSGPCAWECGG